MSDQASEAWPFILPPWSRRSDLVEWKRWALGTETVSGCDNPGYTEYTQCCTDAEKRPRPTLQRMVEQCEAALFDLHNKRQIPQKMPHLMERAAAVSGKMIDGSVVRRHFQAQCSISRATRPNALAFWPRMILQATGMALKTILFPFYFDSCHPRHRQKTRLHVLSMSWFPVQFACLIAFVIIDGEGLQIRDACLHDRRFKRKPFPSNLKQLEYQ